MSKKRLTQFISAAALMSLLTTGTLWAGDAVLHLEMGDPERRAREASLTLDAITDTRSGELLSPAEVAARLAGRRIVFLGESHTDMDFHMAQLQVIAELHRAGRKVLVGLEMFPYMQQPFLDDWVAGKYSEAEFLEASNWYDNWGYHWNYYRDIFRFARDNGLPMYALNTPREVIAAVRKKGFDDLTEEEAAHIPKEIDSDNEDHLRLFKAFFEDEEGFHAMMSEEQWRRMLAAQASWDATFGHNALRAMEKHPESEAVLVMLVGSGHVVYDLGIQRQLKQWTDLPTTAVIPISVRNEDDEPITAVQASYADFVWGMPPEPDPLYPRLGTSTRKRKEDERRSILDIDEDSVAAQAGFEVGDVLLSMDGEDLPDKKTLNRLMAGKMWGDKAGFKVLRGDEAVELEVAFRRSEPKPKPEQEQEPMQGDEE